MTQFRSPTEPPSDPVRQERGGRPFLIPKHWKLELWVLEALCSGGAMSTREVMEHFPEDSRPAYFTIRSTLDRLQSKKLIRHVRTVAGSQVFQAVVNVGAMRDLLLDEFAELFTDDIRSALSRLIHTGRLTREDLAEIGRMADEELAARLDE